jgi:hypothetical protein
MRIERSGDSGPFTRRLFYKVHEIDDICESALASSDLLPEIPGSVDIERFVEKHFRCEVGYEELPDEILGFTAFDEAGKVIAMRVQTNLEDGTDIGERRVRSTWAHEAGHGLLHGRLFIADTRETSFIGIDGQKQNRIMCRPVDIKPVGIAYDGKWWEWQANRCIGGLLLPKGLVRSSVDHFLTRSVATNSPRLGPSVRGEAERHIAKIFNVNPVVARIRLHEIFPDVSGAQLEF